MTLVRQTVPTLLLCLLSLCASAGVIVMQGEYQRQNIYVRNAISGSGVGYCTYEVTVNGHTTIDEINSTSFEIDLHQFAVSVGTPMMVSIKYKDDGCNPRVLNPNALIAAPTFETLSIEVDRTGTLSWTTINENNALPFVIEQFKWNKWVKIGEVNGIGNHGKNSYTFQTNELAGVNKFRIRQDGHREIKRYSPVVSYRSMKSEVTFVFNHTKRTVEFSEATSYEMYDKYGSIVKKGYGRSADVASLKRDTYYMHLGNTSGEFRKR